MGQIQFINEYSPNEEFTLDKRIRLLKERKLKQTEWKLKRNAEKLDSDKECQEALMKIVQTRIESAKLEEGYCKKMCKVVPAQKVYAMMLAEDAFHRELLQAAGQRKNKNHNQPPRRP